MSKNTQSPPPSGEESDRLKKRLLFLLPFLFVFVSITSFLAGIQIGRTTDHNMGQMLDTIILTPTHPTEQPPTIDFSGRIYYSDGTPYANQLIELHSDPMRTRTDSNGFFRFKSVEIGDHELSMLDESGQVKKRVAVSITKDTELEASQIKGHTEQYELAISGNAIEIQVRIRVDEGTGIIIESEIYTKTETGDYYDQSGREVPAELFEPTAQTPDSETTPESGEGILDEENNQAPQQQTADQTGKAPQNTSEEIKPAIPAEIPTETTQIPPETPPAPIPVPPPLQPDTTTDSGNSGGDDNPSHEPEPDGRDEPLAVSVSEKNGLVWSQNTTISLFANRTGAGPERKLAPGSEGSYSFLVNNGNSYRVRYHLELSEPEEQLALPLYYRLKSNGKYICGDNETWLTAGELASEEVILEPGISQEYLLEWQWAYDGGDDAYDTAIGMASNLSHLVVVKIRIEQITG